MTLAASATGLPLCVKAMVGTFNSRASVKARTSSALRPEKDEPMSTSLGRAAAERTARYVAADYRFVELDAGHWLPETQAARVVEEVVRRAT